MDTLKMLLGVALAALPLSAFAAAAPASNWRSCEADRAAICSAFQNSPDILKCLNANRKKVSPACFKQLEPKMACIAEKRKFCPDAKPGTDITLCMEKHNSQLSPACRDAFPCMTYKAKFCSAAKGGNTMRDCLLAQSAKLSPACLGYLKKTEVKSP